MDAQNTAKKAEKMEKTEKEIFSILYEVNDQRYVIGITYDAAPKIASRGVNTGRPLPSNIKQALIAMVRKVRNLKVDPEFLDFNLPSEQSSLTLLGNFTVTPETDQPMRTSEEVLRELQKKLETREKREERKV
jgi:hypothetical protein